MMRKFLVFTALSSILILSYGQDEQPRYVLEDDVVMDSVITTIARNYESDDMGKQAELKSIIRKAFKQYFDKRKVSSTKIFFPEHLWQLDQHLDSLKDANGKLSQENFQTKLSDLKQDHENRMQEISQLKNMELGQCKDSIVQIDIEIDRLKQSNEELVERANKLSSQTQILEGISSDFGQKEIAFNAAYENSKRPLSEIVDVERMKAAVDDYEKSLIAMKQVLNPEQKRKKEEIESCLIVAGYYQRVVKQLNQKYDKKESAELLKAVPKMRILNNQHKKDIERVTELLKDEVYVLKNFRNGIIGSLKDLGSICDIERMNEVLGIINDNVEVYTVDEDEPNRSNDGYGYNVYYVFINNKLKDLRKAVKEYQSRKFDDPKTFKAYLERLSGELGDPVY